MAKPDRILDIRRTIDEQVSKEGLKVSESGDTGIPIPTYTEREDIQTLVDAQGINTITIDDDGWYRLYCTSNSTNVQVQSADGLAICACNAGANIYASEVILPIKGGTELKAWIETTGAVRVYRFI